MTALAYTWREDEGTGLGKELALLGILDSGKELALAEPWDLDTRESGKVPVLVGLRHSNKADLGKVLVLAEFLGLDKGLAPADIWNSSMVVFGDVDLNSPRRQHRMRRRSCVRRPEGVGPEFVTAELQLRAEGQTPQHHPLPHVPGQKHFLRSLRNGPWNELPAQDRHDQNYRCNPKK